MRSRRRVIPETSSSRKYQSSGEHMNATRHTCCSSCAIQNVRSHIEFSCSTSRLYPASMSRFRVAAPNRAAHADAERLPVAKSQARFGPTAGCSNWPMTNDQAQALTHCPGDRDARPRRGHSTRLRQ
jgi:hypothetical protein